MRGVVPLKRPSAREKGRRPWRLTHHAPLVSLHSVTKEFEDQTALRSVSLDVRHGEFLTLLGPSGCGKTTLLRCIAGFETPDGGDISIGGKRVNDLPPEKREVNTVFQSYALFPHMTVFQNVAFGLELKNYPKDRIREEVLEALRLVHLEHLVDRRPHQLSGGQQQRVAFARAVVNRPLVLLLDEPLSALDARLRKAMQIELKQLHRKLGITFIFVTHDQEEAFSMSDRVVVMNNGDIEQVGTPTEIYEEPANLFVAGFVGEINVLDGVVTERNGRGLRAVVENVGCTLQTKRSFEPGQRIKVLMRPEDLVIETVRDVQKEEELQESFRPDRTFRGRVVDTVYKGATYDVFVDLDDHKRIIVTEFFNEDDESVYFRPGDAVVISWYEGWEVVLPEEEAGEDYDTLEALDPETPDDAGEG